MVNQIILWDRAMHISKRIKLDINYLLSLEFVVNQLMIRMRQHCCSWGIPLNCKILLEKNVSVLPYLFKSLNTLLVCIFMSRKL